MPTKDRGNMSDEEKAFKAGTLQTMAWIDKWMKENFGSNWEPEEDETYLHPVLEALEYPIPAQVVQGMFEGKVKTIADLIRAIPILLAIVREFTEKA